ncbi:hypothetical protein [Rothia sp. L_38]|uniref:hypothetical protein n=1 Tax=Rothia sp. L_38 TaxID=3422315 RepID=UPI003D6A501D
MSKNVDMLSAEDTLRIPKKLGMSFLIGVGWIAVGAWFIHNPPDWRYHRVLASGVGCIVAGIFTFIYYCRRRYALILTPEGFYNHSTVLDLGNHLILWSVIGDIAADRQGKEIRAVIADTHAYNWTLTGIRVNPSDPRRRSKLNYHYLNDGHEATRGDEHRRPGNSHERLPR